MKSLQYSILISIIYSFCSCGSTHKATYFYGLQDSIILKQAEEIEPILSKNDIVQITVASLNPEASSLFNMVGSAGGISSGSGQGSSYLIYEDGFIQFPILGQIKASGITKKALASEITKQLINRKLLVDPIVSVRLTNFHVTVLGEVKGPALIPVANERINILEAIGLAGDLTLDAKRDNVLLIREKDGDKIIRRIDLNSPNILSSPYYHLQSNDIVYVEPNKGKVSSASQGRQLIPIIFSSISVAILVLDRILN